MLNNETRRSIIDTAKSSGYEGDILELFRQAEQGMNVPAMLQGQQEQEMQVANTPQEQEQGLRQEHAQGNTGASMSFPDVAPNTSFNTKGMKAPINIEKFDTQGHLVQSYKNVPPGIQDLPTGPARGTVIETPAYKTGGYRQKTFPK